MTPAVDALSQSHRVITFPLCDEPSARAPFHRERGIDAYVSHIVSVLDAATIERAAICGISFGGLIALRVCRDDARAGLGARTGLDARARNSI